MRPATTETAISLLFSPALQAHIPLGAKDKLGSPDFKVPFSIFYGSTDWMRAVDDDAAEKCLIENAKKHGEKSNIITIENAGHNMHLDNPTKLCEEIIKDLEIE